jgi:DNA-binding transcriptional LysR family regulator
MRLSGIDANLLAALDALLREKSVTRAAQRLGVGQPALSHSLSRLRHHFQDELLVLNGRNYVLTNRAEKLSPMVAKAARALAEVFQRQHDFEAATSTRAFVIACSDAIGMLVLPELLRTLEREAKHVTLELRATVGTSKESMLDGAVDLAVGMFEDVPPGIDQRLLYEDRAVCLVHQDHELVTGRLTLDDYETLPHLEIAAVGDAIPGLHIDRALSALGRRRRVALRVPYCSLAPTILERSACVATVSSLTAALLVKSAPLRVFEPPVTLPSYNYCQIWRDDRADDHAHHCLRDCLTEIGAELGRRVLARDA